MAISTVFDATADFNLNGVKNIDMSGWDTCVIQLVTPVAGISFLSSNDDGSITGQVQGGPLSALNFTAVQAVNLATGVAATSGAATGLWKISGAGRFIQLLGATTAAKILVYLSKIH